MSLFQFNISLLLGLLPTSNHHVCVELSIESVGKISFDHFKIFAG